MDKKTKIFFLVFFFLIFGSVAFTYYRIMVKKDYILETQADCDPENEKCFIWECDPNSNVEGEACTGDLENDIWYYKIVRKNASRTPLCDPEEDEECDPFLCQAGEIDCEEILCDAETKAEQEAECNDPAEYLANNPASGEEMIECEEGDEECAPAEEETGEENSDTSEETPADDEE